ncbi:MAG: hemolysin family protein [Actinomycetia bacterium]|nr:hemolysin family protein [Actinomycetes bacterium]
MGNVWLDTLLVFVFFLIGGVFAAAEMALVSLRSSQVAGLIRQGKRGRAVARLLASPNRFLSAVQIGVTLSGFLSASFGGASLANMWLTPILLGWGMPPRAASVIALVAVTVVISFVSIVISELTAKRLGMQRPEGIALTLAPLLNGLASAFRPVIWLMGVCTNVLVRALGGDPAAGKSEVSSAELRSMVSSAPSLGVEERHIVDEVFSAGGTNLREVMVPRTEVDFLSGDMLAEEALHRVRDAPHSRYPVIGGSPDRVLGFLHVRDLMDMSADVRTRPLRRFARPVLFLPETVQVLPALTRMRRRRAHLAVVQDEYGGTAGIITLEDLVEELIGEITDEYDVVPGAGVQAERGDLDGLLTVPEFAERTGYALPDGPYDTLGGFLMAQLGRLPEQNDEVCATLMPAEGAAGDAAPAERRVWRLRVTEMDGRRIAWVRAVPDEAPSGMPPAETSETPS